MHATVNRTLCQGHGRCSLVCPEVFDLDDDGFVVLVSPDVPVEHERAAELAARNCPERAIATV